jgi:hypothetical protein
MKDEKGYKQYKNGSKGKNLGQTKKKSRLGHGCLSVVSVVCCQVEVSATGWSLVQRSLTECGVSKKYVIVKPRKMRRPRPPRGCRSIGEKKPGSIPDGVTGILNGKNVTKNVNCIYRIRKIKHSFMKKKYPDKGKYIFLYSKMSRRSVGPTQPPVHFGTGVISRGKATGTWNWLLISI